MSDKYVNIKVKKETRDTLKKVANILNELNNSSQKITVAGLITNIAIKYNSARLAMDASGNLDEWINNGMPIVATILTNKNSGAPNESK